MYPGGRVIRDAAGDILRVSLGEDGSDCRPIYLADPEDWIVKAVIASEDGTFWKHWGVRPESVLRAAAQNLAGRRRVSGASTITMQAVRLIAPHPKNLWWKFKEAVMALKLEREHDKCWILSQYLNRAPFGSNLIGIEAAAQGWFGKRAKALGLGEAAMLAGIVQRPTAFRPDRHLDLALIRRDYVLGRMRLLGMIDDDQLEAAKDVTPQVVAAPRPFKAPHFCDWVLATGARTDTALNPEVQLKCETLVNEAAAKGGYRVAMVVLRSRDAEVLGMAVSGGYSDKQGGMINTAVTPRPAGSTLKPFLAAKALDMGLVRPETMLEDRPKTFTGYRPANFDGTYRGEVSLRDSLILSLNLPFVNLLGQVGVPMFGMTLSALGFRHLKGDVEKEYGLGLAIGNAEVTLLELARAYAVLARGGDGVFSKAACDSVSAMLAGDERASAALGHIADAELPRYAWKTGTSSAYRDAWTVLWNEDHVIGVWCGHLSGGFGDENLVGAKAAAPLAWSLARLL